MGAWKQWYAFEVHRIGLLASDQNGNRVENSNILLPHISFNNNRKMINASNSTIALSIVVAPCRPLTEAGWIRRFLDQDELSQVAHIPFLTATQPKNNIMIYFRVHRVRHHRHTHTPKEDLSALGYVEAHGQTYQTIP